MPQHLGFLLDYTELVVYAIIAFARDFEKWMGGI